jgi:solute carrier family 13 (sodium-dependent dicarboxylate transporter), member 2/3/5
MQVKAQQETYTLSPGQPGPGQPPHQALGSGRGGSAGRAGGLHGAGAMNNKVNDLDIPAFGVAIVFSLIAVLLSNVMSNTAAASILVPLGLALPMPYGMAVPVIVAISCSCSLLLPVSTPSNAISYATGLVEQKDFRPGGLMLILLGPLTAILAVMLWVWFY